MNKTQFHSVMIGGLRFAAVLSADGPYLVCSNAYGGIALGHCTSLRKFKPADLLRGNTGDGWWAVKYGDQTHIDLRCLSDAEVRRLGREFGVPLWPPTGNGCDDFFASPAFAGLVTWVGQHPILAKRYSRECNSYVGDWLTPALAAAGKTSSKVPA
jgi:hypothetical protein